MSNRTLMADISSNNDTAPKLHSYRAAGHRWLGVKATEGNGYVNPNYARIVEQAHRAGVRVVHYHFGVAGVSGVAQAMHFLQTIRPHLRRGDAVAYDCEGQPSVYRQWRTGEAATVARSFLAFVDDHGPRLRRLLRRRGYHRVIYGPAGFISSSRVPRVRGWWLWVAYYTASALAKPEPAVGWRRWAIWQFTEAGTVAGIRGTVDVSRLRYPFALPRPHRRRHKKGNR